MIVLVMVRVVVVGMSVRAGVAVVMALAPGVNQGVRSGRGERPAQQQRRDRPPDEIHPTHM